MVCVPCFIIPLLLYIWHKFVQPIMLRYWNPWEKKDASGNVIKTGPEFPFECKGGACPYPGAKKKLEAANTSGNPIETNSTAAHGKHDKSSSQTQSIIDKKDD